MKNVLLPMLTICLSSCNTLKQFKESTTIKTDTTMIQQYGEIEKYDFVSTENGTKTVIQEQGAWVIEKREMTNYASYVEYAPTHSFYEIGKLFYANGMIKQKVSAIGSVRFGMYEEFDEDGKLIKLIDEDKKFGKLKPQDIVAFLEKESWFNRQTGENRITQEPVLPNNGYFYKKIMENMIVRFFPAGDDTHLALGAKKTYSGSKWVVIVLQNQTGFYFVQTKYIIDGETGEFEKEVGEKQYFKY